MYTINTTLSFILFSSLEVIIFLKNLFAITTLSSNVSHEPS